MKVFLFLISLLAPLAVSAASMEARVTTMTPMPCPNGEDGCYRLTLERDGTAYGIDIGPQDYLGGREPGFGAGDRIVLQQEIIDGEEKLFVSDVVRRPALLWLFALFAVCAVLLGRKGAVRALLGMILSFALLFGVFLPAILRGVSPLLVAIVGGFGIMVITLLVSHGRNGKTWSALLGTAVSLVVTGLLAWLFSQWASMTGMDEDTLFLLADYPDLNTQGILLAGIVIGTLGVLDDVAISQASAVFELRAANVSLSVRELFTRALRIGQDHIAAAVNTLILAYAGSALPLLLLITGIPSDESLWITLNREMIAAEILRMLVGSIGLLAAVPVTTWIASALAVKLPPQHNEADRIHRH